MGLVTVPLWLLPPSRLPSGSVRCLPESSLRLRLAYEPVAASPRSVHSLPWCQWWLGFQCSPWLVLFPRGPVRRRAQQSIKTAAVLLPPRFWFSCRRLPVGASSLRGSVGPGALKGRAYGLPSLRPVCRVVCLVFLFPARPPGLVLSPRGPPFWQLIPPTLAPGRPNFPIVPVLVPPVGGNVTITAGGVVVGLPTGRCPAPRAFGPVPPRVRGSWLGLCDGLAVRLLPGPGLPGGPPVPAPWWRCFPRWPDPPS